MDTNLNCDMENSPVCLCMHACAWSIYSSIHPSIYINQNIKIQIPLTAIISLIEAVLTFPCVDDQVARIPLTFDLLSRLQHIHTNYLPCIVLLQELTGFWRVCLAQRLIISDVQIQDLYYTVTDFWSENNPIWNVDHLFYLKGNRINVHNPWKKYIYNAMLCLLTNYTK